MTDEEVRNFLKAYRLGTDKAEELLVEGQLFYGAFNVADRLYSRDTREWWFAMNGARDYIKDFEVFVDTEGVISKLSFKSAFRA